MRRVRDLNWHPQDSGGRTWQPVESPVIQAGRRSIRTGTKQAVRLLDDFEWMNPWLRRSC